MIPLYDTTFIWESPGNTIIFSGGHFYLDWDADDYKRKHRNGKKKYILPDVIDTTKLNVRRKTQLS